jgi:DNA/RNA endonuclease YhcR with UshA esterase domain
MITRTIGLALLSGFLVAGVGVDAHHSLAGVYDLNKEITLTGALKKLNFTNPHASIELTVFNADGSTTDWVLVTASNRQLTQRGITKNSIKPGDELKITILPAMSGNPMGFIRRLEVGERQYQLFNENGPN